MKPKKKIVTVIDKTLGMVLRVQFGGTMDEACNEFQKYCGCVADTSDGDEYDAWASSHMNMAFIYCSRFPKNPDAVAVFTHELTHAVTLFCDYTEIKCGEVYAKLVQYFHNEVMTKLKKK
jgi:hypothetical protein